MDFDAPFSLLLLVSPRLADNAAPAAFCWACDFAGICISCLTEAADRRADRPLRARKGAPLPVPCSKCHAAPAEAPLPGPARGDRFASTQTLRPVTAGGIRVRPLY